MKKYITLEEMNVRCSKQTCKTCGYWDTYLGRDDIGKCKHPRYNLNDCWEFESCCHWSDPDNMEDTE